MKTLKSTKRRAMAAPQKSASQVSHHSVAGETETSRSHAPLRHIAAARSTSAGRASGGHRGERSATPERPRVDGPYQSAIRNFETAVRAFQKHNYGKAAEIFEKLVQSDARDVAERAHVHLRLCRQRTGRPAAPPKSADDFYTLGIACLNAGEFRIAVEHLSKANKMKARQDHIEYALAVSHSLAGNPDEAIAHLEAAFALRPENRIHARRDEDFHRLAADPRFRRMIYLSGN
jgi:tetratricopeptide (TPR) repeat protein